jgi:hypothetical protein
MERRNYDSPNSLGIQAYQYSQKSMDSRQFKYFFFKHSAVYYSFFGVNGA